MVNFASRTENGANTITVPPKVIDLTTGKQLPEYICFIHPIIPEQPVFKKFERQPELKTELNHSDIVEPLYSTTHSLAPSSQLADSIRKINLV